MIIPEWLIIAVGIAIILYVTRGLIVAAFAGACFTLAGLLTMLDKALVKTGFYRWQHKHRLKTGYYRKRNRIRNRRNGYR